MAASETGLKTEGARYQEPDPSTLVDIPRAYDLGRRAVGAQGFRLHKIDGDTIWFEPRQEGVISYPTPTVTEKPGPAPPSKPSQRRRLFKPINQENLNDR